MHWITRFLFMLSWEVNTAPRSEQMNKIKEEEINKDASKMVGMQQKEDKLKDSWKRSTQTKSDIKQKQKSRGLMGRV